MDALPEHRVDVEGTARRTVAADRVRWSLVVIESGDRPAGAFARAGERLDALTRGLRDGLGDAADVRTGALSVRPQHDDHGRRLSAVDVSGQVTLEVPLADAGRAAGAAMSAGADHLDGPRLEVRDREAVAEALLGEAVEAARRKAEHVAAAAGRRLGHVVSVAEGDEPYPHGGPMSARAAAGPELAPADAEISASVRVRFALED
jgi:uncharacterized protein YggE